MARTEKDRSNTAGTLLLEAAAKYIAIEAGRSTLITPLRAEISSDRKNAVIYVSVFPEEQRDHALAFLIRHKDLFRNYLKKQVRFAVLPYIHFQLDYGELNRQRIDEISRDIDTPDPDEETSELS